MNDEDVYEINVGMCVCDLKKNERVMCRCVVEVEVQYKDAKTQVHR